MNHQPFETWILEEDILKPGDQQLLKDHLQNCESCNRLSEGWNGAARQLQHPAMVEPMAGFSTRWNERLQVDLHKKHRRQSLTLLAFSLGLAFMIALIMVLGTLPAFRAPSLMFWVYFYQLLAYRNMLDLISDQILSFFSTSVSFGNFTPLLWLVFLSGMVFEIVVLWFVSFRVLTKSRRVVS
jgi:hypothetical protein